MTRSLRIVWFFLLVACQSFATEPNETFETATVLSPGVLSVADDLIATEDVPDTFLGARDSFGAVYLTDDDGSHLGDGYASALYAVTTNSGAYSFAVSGYPDFDFVGGHSELGLYEVFVDVFDLFDDLVYEFSEIRQLEPGVVHEFSDSSFEWIGGSYDVYINNVVGTTDVDFFTFTGLPAGAGFTARTLDPENNGIDTYLGWFHSDGSLLEADDDGGGGVSGYLSLIEGIVPDDGMLTFAVTGYPDFDFEGIHSEMGTYELLIELVTAVLPGDYNDDGFVNAADYALWRDSVGAPSGTLENDIHGVEIGFPQYETWKTNFGFPPEGVALESAAVPEPSTWTILVALIASLAFTRYSL